MCSYCAHILVGYSIRHSEDVCPLRKSMYCKFCAKYGHIPSTCTRKPSSIALAPVDPSSLPQPAPQSPESTKPVVELKKIDTVIREYLRNHGQEGSITKQDIPKLLAKHAKKMGIDIRLIE